MPTKVAESSIAVGTLKINLDLACSTLLIRLVGPRRRPEHAAQSFCGRSDHRISTEHQARRNRLAVPATAPLADVQDQELANDLQRLRYFDLPQSQGRLRIVNCNHRSIRFGAAIPSSTRLQHASNSDARSTVKQASRPTNGSQCSTRIATFRARDRKAANVASSEWLYL
jgi:hypothetical protein